MLERIIVPLDGSETAEAILPQIRRLLRVADSEVVFVRSVSLLASGVDGHPISGMDGSFVLRELQTEAASYLSELAERLREDGIKARWLVRVGDPAANILDVARAERATLIAMSTHGRSGLPRWILGSVSEKVLRSSAVPLLLLRSFRATSSGTWERSPATEIPLRRILVPTDLSGISLEVVPGAAELAQRFGARVEVLYVSSPGESGEETPEEACRALAEAIRAFADHGESAVPLLRRGDPAVTILETCREREIDLIAMTTHGRTGLSRWTLGSVTEKILRAAAVPVLVVRQASEAAATASRRRTGSRRVKKTS